MEIVLAPCPTYGFSLVVNLTAADLDNADYLEVSKILGVSDVWDFSLADYISDYIGNDDGYGIMPEDDGFIDCLSDYIANDFNYEFSTFRRMYETVRERAS